MKITGTTVFIISSTLALIVSLMLLMFKVLSVIDIDTPLVVIFICGSIVLLFLAIKSHF